MLRFLGGNCEHAGISVVSAYLWAIALLLEALALLLLHIQSSAAAPKKNKTWAASFKSSTHPSNYLRNINYSIIVRGSVGRKKKLWAQRKKRQQSWQPSRELPTSRAFHFSLSFHHRCVTTGNSLRHQTLIHTVRDIPFATVSEWLRVALNVLSLFVWFAILSFQTEASSI